ncbi:MAG: HlyD family efflux transporter periplasmic adaptor subunit [Deltaproteobacteria bacterium]|nr:HlyD family efflux transporter periplasmic adaptor subunit [Deltaproteobacteria bacterium]
MATKPELVAIDRRQPVSRPPMSLRTRVMIGVWVLAVAIAVYLKIYTAPLAGIEGRVEVTTYRVATIETGRVMEVPVTVGLPVQRGDVLVRLDTAIIDHEISLAEAELQQDLAKLRLDRITEERPFADAVERLRTDIERERVETGRDRADLLAVGRRIRWWQGAVDSKVASSESLEELKAEAEALSRRVASHPAARKALETSLAQATARLDEYRAAAAQADEDGAAGESGVALLKAAIAALRARRDLLTLRAPADALVHRVLMHPGDVARPGDPVVVLRAARSDRVQAYVTDALASVLRIGDPARVMPRDGSLREFDGRLVAIGSVLPIPSQLAQDIRVQPWGVEVVIRLAGDSDLLPGQAVDVQFDRNGDAPPAPEPALATAPSAGPPPELSDARVPPALTAVTAVEPSGLVWLPEFERFLVVTDDTGAPGSDQHPPWVLLMDRAGEFDAHPVAVEGIPALNDVESVARTPDGSLWLLSSQSVSRSGKRPDSRTWLVRAKVEGGRLVSTGHASLASALAALEPATLDGLGIAAADPAYQRGARGFDRVLDIEGMTADGADLLFGLRRPVDGNGRALVWRLTDPGAFLESGRIAPGTLTVAARLDMERSGIADILLLDGNRLAVIGVPLRADDGKPGPDSALWFFDPPEGDARPGRKVRQFPGLGAEGVAIGPEPASLTLVFDRNRETPLWTRVGVR